MKPTILLIDDDLRVLSMLRQLFDLKGWEVFTASDAVEAQEIYEQHRPDLVLLDLQLPGTSGLTILTALREFDPDAAVIMLTGHGDISVAVEAMLLGAENFLTKPPELAHLEAAAMRALEKVRLRRQNSALTVRLANASRLDGLGVSDAMASLSQQIELWAESDGTVLLLGETGTGKGWVARQVHELSKRREKPFLEINCAGLTGTFLESELFGHEKGAYTDAKVQKPGLFEVADQGTLFLDEIGDLAPELQPKLLKVLESRRFRRLGSVREIEVDVRLVAATNCDLEESVKAGRFREDLFYRINVLPVVLPPLRDRDPVEIAEMARRLIAELARRNGDGPARIAQDALDRLVHYSWPGNIRELKNVLERARILARGAQEIGPEHFPPETRGPGIELERPDLSLAEAERRHIARVLAYHGGNRSLTARTLGISRTTLYERLRAHEFEKDPVQQQPA